MTAYQRMLIPKRWFLCFVLATAAAPKSGSQREAEQTADRLPGMLAGTPWLRENYPSSEAAWSSELENRSSPDYNWSCATAIELVPEDTSSPLRASHYVWRGGCCTLRRNHVAH